MFLLRVKVLLISLLSGTDAEIDRASRFLVWFRQSGHRVTLFLRGLVTLSDSRGSGLL